MLAANQSKFGGKHKFFGKPEQSNRE